MYLIPAKKQHGGTITMRDKISGLKFAEIMLCLLVLFQLGCTANSGGSATLDKLMNPNDRIVENVPASSFDAYRAAISAMKELNMPIVAQYGDGSSVQLKSRSSENDVAWVEITPISGGMSKVAVSVDVMSGESRSREILSAIVRNLSNISPVSAQGQSGETSRQNYNSSAGIISKPPQEQDNTQFTDQPEILKPLPKEDIQEKSLLQKQ
jgi:hypothetical protein